MADHVRPPYLQRWAPAGSMQPFEIFGTYLWGFVFPADMASLVRVVDRELNLDRSGRVRFEPLLPLVMFGYSAIDFCQAMSAPYSEIGGAYEYELAVWVPVRRQGSLTPLLFTPYIFVNNPMAVVQGREIYGFPKEMAWVHKRTWPRRFPVQVFVDERRGRRSRRHWVPLASVERVGRRPRTELPGNDFATAASALSSRLLRDSWAAPLAGLAPLLGSMWPPNAPVVFRKQFPDCADSERACYQSVVESGIRVTDLNYVNMLEDPYVLRLPKRDVHPMAGDLGLRDGERALLAYEMKMSFEIQAGRELWTPDAAPAAAGLLSRLSGLGNEVQKQIVDLGVHAAQSLLSARPEVSAKPRPRPRRRAAKRAGRKQRIAVLGGGAGAMAAVFALTQPPDWKERYDITVYQMGWRLGGKGACGRDASRHERIEEHGMHMWFGYYENAFRMMRHCYEALQLGGEYEDPILWGFEPQGLMALMQRQGSGWSPTLVRTPPAPGWPGKDVDAEGLAPTPRKFLALVLRWVLSHLLAHDVPDELNNAGYAGAVPLAEVAPLWERLRGLADPPHATPDLATHPANLLGALAELAALPLAAAEHALFATLLDRILRWLADSAGDLRRIDQPLSRLWVVMDLARAIVVGMLRDGVIDGDFERIDDQDFAEWLVKHGAHPQRTARSVWVRSLYSMAFAFEDGDAKKPRAAAGTTLRSLGRLFFTYRHSAMFRMRSGMGDVVFAPLYRLLVERGVKFEFFHRVQKLHVSADGKSIDGVTVRRQATPRSDYAYVREVKGRWCWPNQPDYTRLREGEEIEQLAQSGAYVNLESVWSAWGPDHEDRLELKAGRDFDQVVLGISVGALGEICEELTVANPDWKAMLSQLKTVRTQAFQLWLNRPVWPANLTDHHDGHGPIFTAFADPIDSGGDMSHVLPTEAWPTAAKVKQLTYFCAALKDEPPDPDWYADNAFPGRMHKHVRRNILTFLRRDIQHLWPRLVSAGEFKWAALVDTQNGSGAARLDDQFWLANIDPSSRYVLSLPGTTAARLRSDRSRFANLFLAGDWTYNGINAGCVEAAVMSGFRAARAIGGWPRQVIGEDHIDGAGPEVG